MAYPAVTGLNSDATGFDVPSATYSRKAVLTIGDKKLRKEYGDKMIFSNWMGESSKGELSPILYRNDLSKGKGDTLRMFHAPLLTGAGVAGDGQLTLAENTFVLGYNDVYVNQIRNAVTNVGKMSDQRGLFNVLEIARPALADWLAQLKEDYIIRCIYYKYAPHVNGHVATYYGLEVNSGLSFPARRWFCADESNNGITYSATVGTHITNVEAGEATLSNVASDKFSPGILEGIGVKMRVLNIPRISFKGFSGYLCVLHPYQVAQLRTHSDWFNAQLHAGPRDDKGNNVFAGVNNAAEVGVWNNFYIMESNKIGSGAQTHLKGEEVLDGNADSNVRRAICMGAGSVAYAEAGIPSHETENRDYGNINGLSIGNIFGCQRADYFCDITDGTAVKSQNLIVVTTYSPATVI